MSTSESWSNDQWLCYLQQGSPQFNQAVEELRRILHRSLKKAFRYKCSSDVLEDISQESIVKILGCRASFQGRSRFTTWATKVAVNMTLTELRRKRWQDVSIDDIDISQSPFPPSKMSNPFLSPETSVMRQSVAETLNRMIDECLSTRQKQALHMAMFYGMPLEEVARRLDTNRNALYKLLHDSRKTLKKAMEDQGLDRMEILSVMLLYFIRMIWPLRRV